MAAPGQPKTGGRQKGTPNKPKPIAEGDSPDLAPGPAAKFPGYRLARVDQLVGAENNARTHSAAQIKLLARLITEYGFTNPILTDGRRGIIAGHGRVLAAQSLGMVTVPTIELKHLNAAQRRAYVLADNASALQAGWDKDLLGDELQGLRDDGFDLSLTGFEGAELNTLLGDTDLDDAPDEDGLDGKVCCPSCGHEFKTVSKAFRLIASKA